MVILFILDRPNQLQPLFRWLQWPLLKPISTNFGFLDQYDTTLVGLASLAERYFAHDPVTCLMKLQQFGELLAQQVAARAGVFVTFEEAQSDLLACTRDVHHKRDY